MSARIELDGLTEVSESLKVGADLQVGQSLDASLLAHETVEEVSLFTPYVNVGVASASMGVAGTF